MRLIYLYSLMIFIFNSSYSQKSEPKPEESKTIKELSEIIVDITKKVKEADIKLNKEQLKSKQLTGEIKRLKGEINDLKISISKVIAKYDTLVSRLNAIISAKDSTIINLEGTIAILEGKISLMSAKVSKDSMQIVNLEEGINKLQQRLNEFYSELDRQVFNLRAYQADGIFVDVPNDGLELNEKNTYEIKSRLLRRLTIETEEPFNTSQKALKYDLVYYQEGSEKEYVRKDQRLWNGKDTRDILTSESFDFTKYKKGIFQLIIYYEENLQQKIYITKKFTLH